jgi:hypothetical protein
MTVLLADYFGYSSTLKVEAVLFSETSVHFHQTMYICHHIPEDIPLRSHRSKNLKCN